MRRFLTLFWITAAPAATLAAGWWLARSALRGAEGGADAAVAACLRDGLLGLGFPAGCAYAREPLWLMAASLGVVAASLGLLALFRVLARTVSWSRLLLAATFRATSMAAVIAGGLVAAIQVLLVTAALFLFWRAGDPSADITLMAPFALLALVVALMGVFSSLRLFEPVRMTTVAYPVGERDQPALMGLIQQVAAGIDARPPDNVILGLEPTFFATSGHVRLPFRSKPLSGETLYLSLPFLRVLSASEIKAVIGHELAHFSGRDTAYSRFFAPSYAGLMQAYGDFASGRNVVERVFTYPARALIADMLSVYDRVIARIDREREKRADQIGASVSSSEDLACALVKTGVFGALWGFELKALLDRSSVGLATRNLSRNFADSVEYDIKGPDLPGMIAKSLEERIPHPSDRHPTTETRLALVGFPKERLSDPAFLARRFFEAAPASGELDPLDFLEEQLTAFYRKAVRPQPSEQAAQAFGFSKMLSDFIALMVVADGTVDRREMALAERRAKAVFEAFDARDFRERCRHAGELPSLHDLVRFAGKYLTAEEAGEIKRILREIAMADGALHDKERAMLEHVEQHLQGTYRPETPPPDAPPAESAV